MALVCKNCNKAFQVSPSRVGKRTNCSKECYSQYRIDVANAKQLMLRHCACGCGKKIKAYDKFNRLVRFAFSHQPKREKGYSNAGTYKKGHEGLRGSDNPTYKGGGITSQGYKQISINGKRYLEHRVIMEKHLKRKLETNEHVHHINHDKLDNRIENLEILDNVAHGYESAMTRWGTA